MPYRLTQLEQVRQFTKDASPDDEIEEELGLNQILPFTNGLDTILVDKAIEVSLSFKNYIPCNMYLVRTG